MINIASKFSHHPSRLISDCKDCVNLIMFLILNYRFKKTYQI